MNFGPRIPAFFGAGALLICPSGISWGQTFLRPGDTASFEIEIENEAPSTATAQGVRITPSVENANPSALGGFISFDAAGSILGPQSINVGAGNAKTFRVKIVVAAGAPDGSFNVRAKVSETSDFLLSPDPSTLDTSVNIIRKRPQSLDEPA